MISTSLVALTVFSILLSPTFVDAQKSWKSHTVEDEFSFQYPSNWKLEERENRFTETDAKLIYGKNVVQVIFRGFPEVDANVSSDDEKIQALESIIEEKNDGNIFESSIDKQMTNSRMAPYVIGTFSQPVLFGKSLNMVVLITALYMPTNQLVLVEYYAQDDEFDKYLATVKQVINSIMPSSSAG